MLSKGLMWEIVMGPCSLPKWWVKMSWVHAPYQSVGPYDSTTVIWTRNRTQQIRRRQFLVRLELIPLVIRSCHRFNSYSAGRCELDRNTVRDWVNIICSKSAMRNEWPLDNMSEIKEKSPPKPQTEPATLRLLIRLKS